MKISAAKVVATAIVALCITNPLILSLHATANDPSGKIAIPATLSSGVSVLQVGAHPLGMVYDPNTGMIYVANHDSLNVTVINPNNNKVVGSIYTGQAAWTPALDPKNGLLYVGNDFTNVITVINPENMSVVGNISTGYNTCPIYIIYDPYNGNIYAPCDVTGSIVVINATYNVVSSVMDFGAEVGTGTLAITPWNDYLYVANWYSDTVTIVNGANDSIVGTVTVGSWPGGVIYDPLDHMIYVAVKGPQSSYEHTVVAINPTNSTVSSSLSEFIGPWNFAYDPADSVIAVGNTGSDNISFLNASSGAFLGNISLSSATNSTEGLMYYAPGNDFYATNQFTGRVVSFQYNVSLLNSVNSTGNGPSRGPGPEVGSVPIEPSYWMFLGAVVVVAGAAAVMGGATFLRRKRL